MKLRERATTSSEARKPGRSIADAEDKKGEKR
jgi:hypothetical protein